MYRTRLTLLRELVCLECYLNGIPDKISWTIDTSFYDQDDVDQKIRDRDKEKKRIAKYHPSVASQFDNSFVIKKGIFLF